MRSKHELPRWVDPWEGAALGLATLLFVVIPAARFPVAPGVDMAMHTALARGLMDGRDGLSPAWGAASAALYPRGFSALLLLIAGLVGFARASVVVAGLSYLVYAAGVLALLRTRLPRREALLLSFLATLAARTPQAFFGWGGNPTALALGLALAGVAAGLARRQVLAQCLLLSAAFVHPVGALAGMLGAGLWLLAAGQAPRPGTFTGVATVALALLALHLAGPQVSGEEKAWIAEYQRTHEALIPGSALALPVEVVRALPSIAGDPWAAACAVALLALLLARRFGTVARCYAALLSAPVLLLVGRSIPGVQALIYPDRFGPALVLATLPLLHEGARSLTGRRARIVPVLVVALLAAGGARHWRWYQEQKPLATRHDLRVIRWIEEHLPEDAVIDGAYGDATQWVPALTGRAVTRPHVHCTLEDEVRAASIDRRAGWRFTGERLRYGEAAPPLPDTALLVVRSGDAALYRLSR